MPENKREKAVVLLSGGMDSLVSAFIVRREYEIALLHVQYGQKTETRELKAFNDIAEFFGAREKLVIRQEIFRRIGGSSLTDQRMAIPMENPPAGNIPSTYVPFRNANLLSAAVSWAEAIHASAVVIGAVEADSSGYPDCREKFFRDFQEAVNSGTRPETRINILTPVIHMSKSEIVRVGTELGAPFQLSWSCYARQDVACGRCDSCRLRLRAFAQAGIKDPLPYETGGAETES